ncbi:MAG: hypothetical protein KGS46_09900, partial [Chloroflexi bacterium]|nr:hypothetical protein [Chloroflexota bacterium]
SRRQFLQTASMTVGLLSGTMISTNLVSAANSQNTFSTKKVTPDNLEAWLLSTGATELGGDVVQNLLSTIDQDSVQ